jgi:hypothetical protein
VKQNEMAQTGFEPTTLWLQLSRLAAAPLQNISRTSKFCNHQRVCKNTWYHRFLRLPSKPTGASEMLVRSPNLTKSIAFGNNNLKGAKKQMSASSNPVERKYLWKKKWNGPNRISEYIPYS